MPVEHKHFPVNVCMHLGINKYCTLCIWSFQINMNLKKSAYFSKITFNYNVF